MVMDGRVEQSTVMTDAHASVIVCTRDRSTDAVRAVRSLLSGTMLDIEVVVLDQSAGDETQSALESLGDARLRYVRSPRLGKGRAMNAAAAFATSQFLVFTDDDCEVQPDWLEGILRPFETMPDVGLVFTNVIALDHDRSQGYIPDFVRDSSRVVPSVRSLVDGWGLGAAMAIRREVFVTIGGADEYLGPGGLFPSADDLDLELRVMLMGWRVYECADVYVIHRGFRNWEEGRAHTVRDWSGIGGCVVKLLRARRGEVLGFVLLVLWKKVFLSLLTDIVHLRKPRIRRLTAFVGAFVHGLRMPIDAEQLRYVVD
jgi:GT2 family glycosyltransferase